MKRSLASLAILLALSAVPPAAAQSGKPLSSAEILQRAGASDWRTPRDEDLLYLELDSGRVVIELAPEFAPRHAANIRALARERYYDGLAIVRAQDNYVVQWGDPAQDEKQRKPVEKAQRTLPAEFARGWDPSLPFSALADGDIYAPAAGHVRGFPVAGDPQAGRVWLAHCYAMVGAGRDVDPDSGGGLELYVVTGHAPRHLDRNVTLVGRVLAGMERLSTLPRGHGALGFYEGPDQQVPVRALRVAADMPEAQRSRLQVLRTDTPTWRAFVDARRHRREDWFAHPAGRIELCNVPIPVRPAPVP
jgi:peptidylprolyl isomerase